jgi:hypothetical protein
MASTSRAAAFVFWAFYVMESERLNWDYPATIARPPTILHDLSHSQYTRRIFL